MTDLEVSEPLYTKPIGAEPAMTLPSGQLLGPTLHDSADPAQSFSASAPGMDHVRFGVSGRPEIEQRRDHLDQIGVEHSGNALEFFHLAG